MPDRLIGSTVCPIAVPTPFPVGPINCYLLRGPGGPPVLVDAGPHTPEAWQAIIAGLARWDTPITALGTIIITHGHPDHYGQAARLAAASGAQVWGPDHEADRAFIEDHPAELFRWVAFLRSFMPRTGFPAGPLGRLCRMIEERTELSRPVRLSRTLRDGDRLAAGGLEFTVLHAPGHTPGLFCLHAPEAGLLLSSDHILPTITPNPVLQRFAEDRKQKIHALLDGGPLPLYQVAMGIFPDLPEDQHLLAVFDTIGHADLLVGDGRAAYVPRDDLLYLGRA
jgi:glyoxylase-like metal-dependent hydrolase (beta-lactamase superfamily II)